MRTLKLLLLAVLAAALLAVPALAAEHASTGGSKPAKGSYTTNVHVQMAPGYKGPIHAWTRSPSRSAVAATAASATSCA